MTTDLHGQDGYRADIDGLRAIAVTAVVLFHAQFIPLNSGFVGVDIFFVISGYLIGGIILNNFLANKFSYADFYYRRARRILPALIFLILSMSVLNFFIYDRVELLEFSSQAISSLVGISNIYFQHHTDYFAPASDQEPLLMTWSLGVEEQFYLAFPLLMMLLFRLPAERRIWWLAGVTAVSFAACLILTRTDPVAAFYGLPSRAWEIGAGATLAMHHKTTAARQTAGERRDGLAWLAGGGLAASLIVFNASTPFPGLAALLPVASTVGLIHARGSFFNTRILSAPPMVFVGKISYSWYLWHWPLLALARRSADFPLSPPWLFVLVALSFAAGWLSWRFVEQPFRRASNPAPAALARYAAALLVALSLPLAYKLLKGAPARLPVAAATAEDIAKEGRGDCLAPFGVKSLPEAGDCRPPHAGIALFGDSHASAYGPGLIESARKRGETVAQFSKSECPPLLDYAPVDPKRPQHMGECAAFQTSAIEAIVQDPQIRTVVLAGDWADTSYMSRLKLSADPNHPIDRETPVRAGLTAVIHRLKQAGKSVILAGDTPRLPLSPTDHIVGDAFPLRAALGRLLDGPSRPMTDRTALGADAATQLEVSGRLRTLASELGVRYFDPWAALCDGSTCQFRKGSVPLFLDSNHLSARGSKHLDWSELTPSQAPSAAAPPSRPSKSDQPR